MSDQNIFYVYEHWRQDTGVCFYVGKGKGKRAWSMTKRNIYHKSIQSQLTAMGLCVHVKIIMDGISEETALLAERDLIKKYGRENLVNLTDGGQRGGMPNPNADLRHRLGAAFRGKKQTAAHVRARTESRIGVPLTDEHKKNISKAHLGKKLSAEHKAKVVQYLYGRKRTADAIERTSASRRRAVICCDDGREFKSVTDAAKAYNCTPGHIVMVCKGDKLTAKGFRFKYKEAA